MSNKDIGFAIIGCGAIAPWHIEAVRASRHGYLVAVADEDKAKAQQVAADAAVVGYGDYHEMLRRSDIDVVSICTPSGRHGEVAIAAVRAGKHVVVEKPVEITLERVDAVLREADKAGVKVSAVFQRRFEDSTRRVKSAIDEGKLGKLVLANLANEVFRPQSYYDSGSWRGTRAVDGGGALMNQGIQGVDLLLHLMGDVESLSAYAGTLVRHVEVEDTAVISLRFRSGALGTIVAATCVYPNNPLRCEILGDRGTVRIEGDTITAWNVEGEPKPSFAPARAPKKMTAPGGFFSQGLEGHIGQIQDTIDAIRENRRPLVDGREGRRAVEFVLAVYESARTGRAVSLPLRSNEHDLTSA
ncbi:MAG TPA: Gfo/Idh/MocA family oxidoreductase [bacterium]|nr:Gfo/Idh/MocA family oxidoreductase [bacterium]